ncbi:hypothetical protein, partial [Limnospira sp. PMC 1243.20]|uniref:hypothetical protein n=1 Tax=Limnospira sp. PMC 1243.20 TaxID=2981041 RepID=UPI0028E10E13
MGSDRLICIPGFVGCRFALPNQRLGFFTPPGRNRPGEMGSDRLICIPGFVGCRVALPNLRLETGFLYLPQYP